MSHYANPNQFGFKEQYSWLYPIFALMVFTAILCTPSGCKAQGRFTYFSTRQEIKNEATDFWACSMDTVQIRSTDGLIYFDLDGYFVMESFTAENGDLVMRLESETAGDVAVINAEKTKCAVTLGNETITYYLQKGGWRPMPKLKNSVPNGKATLVNGKN